MTMKIFNREPALWLAATAVAIKLISAFWIDLSIDQQAGLNAVAATAVGLITAVIVRDGINAAILGIIQALIACAIGFGLHLSADNQALIMSAFATLAAMFVRTQAVAPVSPDGTPRPNMQLAP